MAVQPIDSSPRTLAETITDYANQVVKGVVTLTVKTEYVLVAPNGDVDFDHPKPIALTELTLNGDCHTVIPLTVADGSLKVDQELYDLHDRNVKTAMEYRAHLANSLWTAVQGRIR